MSMLAAETDFALGILRQTPFEPTVFSPLSIAIALSVVYTGAKGKTKSEIGNVILPGASADIVESHFGANATTFNEISDVRVDIATRFFLAENFTVKKSYNDFVAENYHVEAVTTDFEKVAKTVDEINGFVRNGTNGKILQLVNENAINPATQALLVNVIYFKAKWKDAFSDVYNGTFYSTKTASDEVEMLSYQNGPNDLLYAENDRLRILKLPYEDEGFELAIFLPKQRHELALFRDTISGKELQDLFANTTSRPVLVSVPKFHIETPEQDLGETLQKLGMETAFTDEADFSGITDNSVLISKVIHKAVITVDREGTEAAAATEVEILDGSSMPPPDVVEFHADEPFLYAVLHNNRPLFFGQYL